MKDLSRPLKIFIFMIFANCIAVAGPITSGGGTGFKTATGTVHLLDTYEAGLNKTPLYLGTAGKTTPERVNEVIQSLSRVMPARADVFKTWAETFFDEIEWVGPDFVLSNPTDLGGVVIPVNSQIVQLSFQRTGPQVDKMGQKRYVFDQTLYNKLSSEDQVALVMHEIIYRDLLAFKMGGSEVVRFLTKQILNTNFSWLDYVKLMANNFFGENEFMGLIDIDPRTMKPTLLAGIYDRPLQISYQNDYLSCPQNFPTKLENLPLRALRQDQIDILIAKGIIPSKGQNLKKSYGSSVLSAYFYMTEWKDCEVEPLFIDGKARGSFVYALENVQEMSIVTDFGRMNIKDALYVFDSYQLEKFDFNVSLDGDQPVDQIEKGTSTRVRWIKNSSSPSNPITEFQISNGDKGVYLTTNTSENWNDPRRSFTVSIVSRGSNSEVLSISTAAIQLANGTGFALGNIEFENLKWPARGARIIHVEVEKTSDKPAPKVGDIIYY